MRINHDITFIDRKGQSFNALVKSSRESGHGEPLVTLIYNAPPTGEPQEVIDVPHISHPSRKENNPELPSYPLHAWKHEEEEHRELPEDHPVHDHFNEQPQKDEQGNIIPKKRPHYEAHIRLHRAQKQFPDAGIVAVGWGPKAPVGAGNGPIIPLADSDKEFVVPIAPETLLPLGHPAHPDTVKFPFACDSCGASVTRTASHHGGKQWEQEILANCKLDPPGTGVSTGPWQEHVCKQEDIDAFRKKIEAAKKPAVVEPSAAERLAAGEQLAPEVKKTEVEADVIAELEKAPPAPSETENKPEDAA